jgi:rRNA maturation endonuclease Nob1
LEVIVRKWCIGLLFLVMLAFPFSASAQSTLKLAKLQVQLWPEYDQPSMLIIYDFTVPDSTSLPVNVSIRMPKNANLVAVASQSLDGNLVNTDYAGPTTDGDWQVVAVKVQTQATYQVEYYQPITKTGVTRQFSYLWSGDYAVDDFNLILRIPVDTSNITTDPLLASSQSTDQTSYLLKNFGAVAPGQPVTLNINYTRTTDTLTVQQTVKPSEPLSSNTEGRVMLSHYLPYFLGGIGMVMILAVSIFFWQSSRGRKSQSLKTHSGEVEGNAHSEIYCHQCGSRAHSGDRFCRVCGSKLRLGE